MNHQCRNAPAIALWPLEYSLCPFIPGETARLLGSEVVGLSKCEGVVVGCVVQPASIAVIAMVMNLRFIEIGVASYRNRILPIYTPGP